MFKRIAFAMAGTLLWLSSGQADELDYSDLDARLIQLEEQLDSAASVKQLRYCGSESGEAGCSESTCCDGSAGGCYACDSCGCDRYYADVQFNFFRAHYVETSTTKLSEEYELSPRFVFGYENNRGQGARVRYWHYGHHLHNLTVAGEGLRTEMDIVDLEVTKRFRGCRTDVVIAGGARFGHFEVFENSPTSVEEDMIGLTFAADVESLLCCDCCSYWSAVYGGRLALLGGDLDQAGAPLIRDDFWRVYELYAGVEYGCSYCGYDLYSRMVFEVQNWHLESFNVDSIGFVGPGFHLGLAF